MYCVCIVLKGWAVKEWGEGQVLSAAVCTSQRLCKVIRSYIIGQNVLNSLMK